MARQALIELYAQEAGERLETLQGGVLDLERTDLPPSQRAARHAELLRLLHGLKGGAMVVEELAAVGFLLHAAEDYLGRRGAGEPLGADEAEPLLQGIDAARAAIAAAVARRPLPALRGALAALGAEPDDVWPDAAEPASASAPEARAPASGEASAAGEGVRVSLADLDLLEAALGEVATCRGAHAQRLEEVEDLLALVELRAAPAALEQVRGQLERLARELRKDAHRLSRASRDAEDAAARLRTLPFSSVFELLRRAHRDLLRRTGRPARLQLEGGDVALDKRALDELRGALLHLVRNALDHGVEPAEARRAAGKPAEACVRVAAERRDGRIHLVVEDDGRGVDEAAVRARAAAAGLADAAEGAPLLELLCIDALSTRGEVDEVSGRGVGVGAVRATVERLAGRLELRSEPGRGTSFRLSLPLTLGSRRGLLVEVAQWRCLIPAPSVLRILRRRDAELVASGGRLLLDQAGSPAEVVSLAASLGLPAARGELLVVVQVEGAQRALEVDRVHGHEEMTVRPLGYPVLSLPGIEGVVAHRDGHAIPVLDLAQLEARGTGDASRAAAQPDAPRRAARVLVVDDSITTRTLERNVLEGAGMQVTVADDGRAALEQVRGGGEFDIVVSDVELPYLNGVELVRELRQSFSKTELPVVLVTSVTADAVRAAGMEAGANALILKQSFEPERLLAVIRALLPEALR
ncbi:MAG: response regulator [Planctomycetota bacterium]